MHINWIRRKFTVYLVLSLPSLLPFSLLLTPCPLPSSPKSFPLSLLLDHHPSFLFLPSIVYPIRLPSFYNPLFNTHLSPNSSIYPLSIHFLFSPFQYLFSFSSFSFFYFPLFLPFLPISLFEAPISLLIPSSLSLHLLPLLF